MQITARPTIHSGSNTRCQGWTTLADDDTGGGATLRRVSRRTHARAAACIALAAAVLGTVAAPARGDGDPASDVLIYQQAFFPYVSPSDSAKAKLSAAVEAAKRAGYPVRVAVIQQRQDLGADPELFGKPQLYARFL